MSKSIWDESDEALFERGFEEFTTGRAAIKNFEAREKRSEMDRAQFAIEMAGILRIPATQAAIMIIRLDRAGWEIRPKPGNV